MQGSKNSTKDDEKKIIVFSGINLFSGGPLSIFYDCLNAVIRQKLDKRFSIILFVHKKSLFSSFLKYCTVIELPKSRINYAYRLWYEEHYFYNFSKKHSIYIWISLHDITPNVIAEKRFVYCHNAAPFYHMSLREGLLNPRFWLFNKFYMFVYRKNIEKNDAIIVQQCWMKSEFLAKTKAKRVLVSRPDSAPITINFDKGMNISNEEYTFFFSAFPRPFKNFEVICEAAMILEKTNTNFKVILTIDGTENSYAKQIYKKYRKSKTVQFIGAISRNNVFLEYSRCDCLIFPSKLESWGLPLSEFKQTKKPILAADLPYAHEAIGEYNLCAFFDPYSPKELAKYMGDLLNKDNSFLHKNPNVKHTYDYYNCDQLLNGLIAS
jgi:glycosyltransferase involved in cell wall biosynthesis